MKGYEIYHKAREMRRQELSRLMDEAVRAVRQAFARLTQRPAPSRTPRKGLAA